MRAILLILIGFSSFVDAGDFSRTNGVVTDARTNLEWQDDYSDNNNDIKYGIWQNAIDYCETLTLDGKSDWRLPNLNELISLVDDTKYSPTINRVFQTFIIASYWSSTSYFNSNTAWTVNFDSGITIGSGKSYDRSVRCVRAASEGLLPY